MTDKFTIEVDKLKKLERSLKNDINKRSDLEQRNQPTSIIEAGIRGQFEEIERVVKSINNAEINNARNLSQNEINRRLSIIQEISNNVTKMKEAYEANITKSLMEKNKQNLLLTSNNGMNEIDNYENFSSGEILKIQEDKIKKQDGMLDEIHYLLKGTKKANQEISDEIKIHTPMLQNLDKNMDSVQSRMKRAHSKLNQYFEKSSNSCLMTTICIQVVLLLIIVLML